MKGFIIVQFVILFSSTAFAQQKFIKTIDDFNNGTSIRVLPTNDQGWLVFSLDSLKLTKFNSCGNIIWSKKYVVPNISNISSLRDFIKTNTGGFALLTRLTNGTINSSMIINLDNLGNIIWSKSFEDPVYNHFPYTLSLDNQGNFIIFGNVSGINNSYYNMICKINANGIIIWTRFYDHGSVWGGAIATSDNGVLARTGSNFIKTDNAGNVQWTSRVFVASTYGFIAPIEVSDGYIFTTYNSVGTPFINFYKIDLQGNLLFGGLKRSDFEGKPPVLRKKSNGNLVGVFNKYILGKNYPTVLEFDKDLNIVNQSSINYAQSGISLFGKDICFSDNGIPILAGIENGSSYPFFSKMNSIYQTNCDTSLNMNFTLDNVSQSFITTNVISHKLNVVDKNVLIESLLVSGTDLCTAPSYLNIGNDTTICDNTAISLQNNTNDLFETYLWSTGETTASITINKPGTYWLVATDNCGENVVSDTVLVTTVPAVIPNLGENKKECENSSVIFTAPHCTNCNYTWSTGSSSDSIEITTNGTYWLKVENSNGCVSIDTTIVEFRKCECTFYVPNAFTPNNSKLNELFKPVYYCDFIDYQLKIYNRWGELLYLTNDKDAGWDGMFNDRPVQVGLYVYIINYKPLIKGKITNNVQKVGSVSVIY